MHLFWLAMVCHLKMSGGVIEGAVGAAENAVAATLASNKDNYIDAAVGYKLQGYGTKRLSPTTRIDEIPDQSISPLRAQRN